MDLPQSLCGHQRYPEGVIAPHHSTEETCPCVTLLDQPVRQIINAALRFGIHRDKMVQAVLAVIAWFLHSYVHSVWISASPLSPIWSSAAVAAFILHCIQALWNAPRMALPSSVWVVRPTIPQGGILRSSLFADVDGNSLQLRHPGLSLYKLGESVDVQTVHYLVQLSTLVCTDGSGRVGCYDLPIGFSLIGKQEGEEFKAQFYICNDAGQDFYFSGCVPIASVDKYQSVEYVEVSTFSSPALAFSLWAIMQLLSLVKRPQISRQGRIPLWLTPFLCGYVGQVKH